MIGLRPALLPCARVLEQTLCSEAIGNATSLVNLKGDHDTMRLLPRITGDMHASVVVSPKILIVTK